MSAASHSDGGVVGAARSTHRCAARCTPQYLHSQFTTLGTGVQYDLSSATAVLRRVIRSIISKTNAHVSEEQVKKI
jgi:hypothetical protein